MKTIRKRCYKCGKNYYGVPYSCPNCGEVFWQSKKKYEEYIKKRDFSKEISLSNIDKILKREYLLVFIMFSLTYFVILSLRITIYDTCTSDDVLCFEPIFDFFSAIFLSSLTTIFWEYIKKFLRKNKIIAYIIFTIFFTVFLFYLIIFLIIFYAFLVS